MGITVTAVNVIIADCTMVWHCWVVWAHNWKVIILPILFVIDEIVCGSNVLDHFTALLSTNTGTNWAMTTMATTLGTSILCTVLIVTRIIYVARGNRGVMGGIRMYQCHRDPGGIGRTVFYHLLGLYDTLPAQG
ncbi:hypothetical protein IW262DRAFT_1511545 [Armillaria fumosa]|nr:hypothetical protein IW262DRAFT_1511545 [Armillaria fumosa]